MILLADLAQRPVHGPPAGFSTFFVVWMLLGLTSFLFFHFNRNASLKRKVLPVFVILTGLIFGGFVYFTMGSNETPVLFVFVPALILITFLNIRSTRFCDVCGRTLHRQPVFRRTQFCPYCGGKLG